MQKRKSHHPVLWTEFWISWYDVWTSAPRKRSKEDILYAALRFIAQGGAGFSYYMFHSGTHFNNLAMYLQTTSYYFDALVDEYGRPSFQFHLLKRINHMLHHLSDLLLCRDYPQVQYLLSHVFAFIWEDPSSHKQLTFLCNDSLAIAYVHFQGSLKKMNPLSVDVFLNDQLLLDSSSSFDWQSPFVDFQPLENSCFKDLEVYQLEIPIQSSILQPSCEFSQLPDMLDVTQDQTDYMWYISSASLSTSCFKECSTLEKVVLDVEMADMIHLFVNQRYIGSSWIKLHDERFANGRKGFEFSLEFENSVYPALELSMDTKLDISILVCSLGLVKGEFQLWKGATMEKEKKGLFKEPMMHFVTKNSNNELERLPLSFLYPHRQ